MSEWLDKMLETHKASVEGANRAARRDEEVRQVAPAAFTALFNQVEVDISYYKKLFEPMGESYKVEFEGRPNRGFSVQCKGRRVEVVAPEGVVIKFTRKDFSKSGSEQANVFTLVLDGDNQFMFKSGGTLLTTQQASETLLQPVLS